MYYVRRGTLKAPDGQTYFAGDEAPWAFGHGKARALCSLGKLEWRPYAPGALQVNTKDSGSPPIPSQLPEGDVVTDEPEEASAGNPTSEVGALPLSLTDGVEPGAPDAEGELPAYPYEPTEAPAIELPKESRPKRKWK